MAGALGMKYRLTIAILALLVFGPAEGSAVAQWGESLPVNFHMHPAQAEFSNAPPNMAHLDGPRVSVRMRIWSLMGQPVVYCEVAWMPLTARNEFVPIGMTVVAQTPLGRVVCDAGALAGPVARSALLTGDGMSFNVPSSPASWQLAFGGIGFTERGVRGARAAYGLRREQERAGESPETVGQRLREQFAALCPDDGRRRLDTRWVCVGRGDIVLDHQPRGLLVTDVIVFADVSAAGYALRLSREALQASEAAAQLRNRRDARNTDGDDFWSTPENPATVEDARELRAAREAVAAAERANRELDATLARRRQEVEVAARGGEEGLCRELGGNWDSDAASCEEGFNIRQLAGRHENRPTSQITEVLVFRGSEFTFDLTCPQGTVSYSGRVQSCQEGGRYSHTVIPRTLVRIV